MGELMANRQWKRLVATAGGLSLALATTVASGTTHGVVQADGPAVHPTVADYTQLTTSTTPPTSAQCVSVGRTCFGPAATRAST
jgi:hypothetical protein